MPTTTATRMAAKRRGIPLRCFGRFECGARVKRSTVDEHAAGERPTSTHCRFCGFEEGPSDARAVRDKPHLQVVVACGSCGHPFAVLSRN
jgi:hypothetical protein